MFHFQGKWKEQNKLRKKDKKETVSEISRQGHLTYCKLMLIPLKMFIFLLIVWVFFPTASWTKGLAYKS